MIRRANIGALPSLQSSRLSSGTSSQFSGLRSRHADTMIVHNGASKRDVSRYPAACACDFIGQGPQTTGWRSSIDTWHSGDSITVSMAEAFYIVPCGPSRRGGGSTPGSGPRNGKAIQKVTGTPFLVGILHSHLIPEQQENWFLVARRCDNWRRWSFITAQALSHRPPSHASPCRHNDQLSPFLPHKT